MENDLQIPPKPTAVQETTIVLTQILTDQNKVEDIYIDNEDVIQETYKTIFMGDPVLSKLPLSEPEDVTNKTLFLVLVL